MYLVLTLMQRKAEWRDQTQRYGQKRVREQPYVLKCRDNGCIGAAICSGVVL